MNIDWPEFEKQLQNFINEAFVEVQKYREEGNDYTTDIKKQMQFDVDGRTAHEVITHTPQIHTLVSRLGENLQNLSSFTTLFQSIEANNTLKNALLVDAGGNEITNDHDRKSWLVNYVLSGIITDQLLVNKDCKKIITKVFDKTFSELKNYVENDNIEYEFSLPITCLKVPEHGFSLETGIEITPLSAIEKSGLISDTFTPLFTINDLFTINAVIKVKRNLPKKVPYGMERFEFENEAKRVLTFAKISGAKDAKGKYIIQTALQRTFMPGGGGRGFSQIYEGNLHFGDVYELNDEKIKAWQERWSKYKVLFDGKNPKSELVIGRLLSSPAIINAYDRLIDYWIILESIFLQDKQELSYKAAIRIAYFLGENAEQRKEIFSKIKKSYNYRSKVVHGSGIPNDINDICNITQAYLLQGLIKIIDQGTFPTNEELDNLVLA